MAATLRYTCDYCGKVVEYPEDGQFHYPEGWYGLQRGDRTKPYDPPRSTHFQSESCKEFPFGHKYWACCEQHRDYIEARFHLLIAADHMEKANKLVAGDLTKVLGKGEFDA